MAKAQPGDVVTVFVNGKACETVIDADGVQRFRQNGALRWFVDAASEGRKANMNSMVLAFLRGAFSSEDYQEFYRLIGYSVSGFSEIFEDAEILNTLREKGDE